MGPGETLSLLGRCWLRRKALARCATVPCRLEKHAVSHAYRVAQEVKR